MDDLIAEFLTETNESLGDLDNDLVLFEQNPNDKDLLSTIFRIIHTIKGTCGFLDLPRLEKVAHHAENLLGRFRDGELEVTPEYVTLIFECLDRIKYILGELESSGNEPSGNDDALIAKLDMAYEGKSLDEDALSNEEEGDMDPVSEDRQVHDGDNESAIEEDENVEDRMLDSEAADIEETAEDPEDQVAEDKEEDLQIRESQLATQSLRVNVKVLENLMTMVSELVLTRNQLLQILRHQKESEFSTPLQRLNQVVSELQEGVMKTRMQPIGNAWAKLPRIVRDISVELKKKIDLQMRGKDTELDRQVLEMIKDPLTHMVRNSADHGLESPEERKKAGKQETGRILLNAYHEGGHIIIEISDDGKGLSVDKIKKKAIEKKLVTKEEIEKLSPAQIQNFIFKAGFSTAEAVTSVSGRGVGMDVVRNNIESIGGSIELKSTEGKGTSFFIKIPLTLAIVSALIVETRKERFAIPQLAVRELVMATENGNSRIEKIKGTPVFRLRDQLLPLVSLGDLLRLKHKNTLNHSAEAGEENSGELEKDSEYIVVTQVGSYQFGIIVDRVYDTEEIVVKPVANILKNIDLFSGNTILGDGSVIMILDPSGIAKTTGDVETSEALGEETGEEHKRDTSKDKTSLLLFEAGDKTPKAVPLSLVSRLENIDPKEIEGTANQMIIQYRGQLMPLHPFNSSIRIESDDAEKPVLVFSNEDKSMGLIVDRIVDIIEDSINIQYDSGQAGILGSAIIKGKATDVIDVSYYVQMADREWFKSPDQEPFSVKTSPENARRKNVMLIDDSPFFRNMLTPLLNVSGYNVTTMKSAVEALEKIKAGEYFDIIVSDIEMPDMDGFEFAEKVRSIGDYKDVPLVALSSYATPQDVDRGREAGFKGYVAKFDKDTLLNTLSETLSKSDAEENSVSKA